jgi:hypothetical protein
VLLVIPESMRRPPRRRLEPAARSIGGGGKCGRSIASKPVDNRPCRRHSPFGAGRGWETSKATVLVLPSPGEVSRLAPRHRDQARRSSIP